jgi:tripartite-type tricarboxylate transporter receptor subunit TctC
MFDNLGIARSLASEKRLRLLGVASAVRLGSLPDVPAVAETLPGFESQAFYTVVAPPGASPQIVDKINADMNAALHDPDVVKRLELLSVAVVGGTPWETSDYLRNETERWNNVIKAANVKLQ